MVDVGGMKYVGEGVGVDVWVGVEVAVGEIVEVRSGGIDCVASDISEVGVAVFLRGAFWIATIPAQ